MRTLFHRFTPRHFLQGWPIFWRMNLPFWVDLLHAAAALLMASSPSGRMAVDRFEARWSWSVAHPVGTELILATGLFLLLWPVVWAVKRGLAHWTDASFWQAQFALVGGLRKLSRWLAALLGVLLFFLLEGHGRDIVNSDVLRGVLTLFAMVLFTALCLSVGMYGWLAEQWKELTPQKVDS